MSCSASRVQFVGFCLGEAWLEPGGLHVGPYLFDEGLPAAWNTSALDKLEVTDASPRRLMSVSASSTLHTACYK